MESWYLDETEADRKPSFWRPVVILLVALVALAALVGCSTVKYHENGKVAKMPGNLHMLSMIETARKDCYSQHANWQPADPLKAFDGQEISEAGEVALAVAVGVAAAIGRNVPHPCAQIGVEAVKLALSREETKRRWISGGLAVGGTLAGIYLHGEAQANLVEAATRNSGHSFNFNAIGGATGSGGSGGAGVPGSPGSSMTPGVPGGPGGSTGGGAATISDVTIGVDRGVAVGASTFGDLRFMSAGEFNPSDSANVIQDNIKPNLQDVDENGTATTNDDDQVGLFPGGLL